MFLLLLLLSLINVLYNFQITTFHMIGTFKKSTQKIWFLKFQISQIFRWHNLHVHLEKGDREIFDIVTPHLINKRN